MSAALFLSLSMRTCVEAGLAHTGFAVVNSVAVLHLLRDMEFMGSLWEERIY